MAKNSIKYFIGCGVPVYNCNFRCEYCYLGQHPNAYKRGIIPFKFSPEYISNYFSVEKLGGYCYFNFCASGETLMHPQIVELVYLLSKQGHYMDIITNGSISKKFVELVNRLDEVQRKHLLIKFSFHYLELKNRDILDRFVENVEYVRSAGISFTIEITPHDKLIPYINEIKEFSLKNFGAWPQITVARNEATPDILLLTQLTREEYKKTWSVFDSEMFNFKIEIFNKKRCEFCYAGLWSIQLNLETGEYYQCYGGNLLGSIKDEKINFKAIGKCRQPHCFNGHAYLTYGNIPSLETPTYAQMRDRKCIDGSHWLSDECREFFSSKFSSMHNEISIAEQNKIVSHARIDATIDKIKRGIIHLPQKLEK